MEAIVKMEGITKVFPGVKALSNVNFEVIPGEVHVLLGENGAGKSTLMKILSGVYQPSDGRIVLNGKKFSKLSPKISSENGLSIIYQELSVVNCLSITENIYMGRLPTKKWAGLPVVDFERMEKATESLLKSINLSKSPKTIVGDLNIGEKQIVEIAKAISFEAKIIIMDEPTSSLTELEAERLFKIINQLKKQGTGIVYISHKLKEVMEIGDRVTILKDGIYVGTHEIKDITIDDLVKMMVGREIENTYQEKDTVPLDNEVLLKVKNLTRKDEYISDISFELYKGEVLGFSGLIGAGRSETMTAIFGAAAKKNGTIHLDGKLLHIKTPYDALKQGIGLVTENRRETGIFKNFSIKKNISISKQIKDAKVGGLWGLLNFEEENTMAEQQQKDMQIKCATLDQNVMDLSGGNQQKVILGKWMATGVKVLIFDEPTKGIDVGTKSEIYKLMRNLAKNGIGVIVVSSELPELLSVCDRIAVMNSGKINRIFDIQDATEEKLVKAATEDVSNSGGIKS